MASRLQQLLGNQPEPTIQPTTQPVSQSKSRLNLIISQETPQIKPLPEPPKLVQRFPSTIETLAELQIDPLSLKEKPKETIKAAWEALKAPVSEVGKDIKDLFTGLKTKRTTEKLGKELEVAAGIGGIFFSPISALFEGASKIPILGSVSKLMSIPFILLGETGKGVSDEIIKQLPIPEQAKSDIQEGMGEIFALATQIIGGMAGAKTLKVGGEKYNELAKKYGEKEANIIIDKAQEWAEQAKEPIPTELAKPKAELKSILPSETPTRGEILPVEKGLEPNKAIIPEAKPEIKPTKKYIEVPREQLPIKTPGAEKGVSKLESRMKGLFETKNVEKAKAEAEERGLDISIYDKMSKPEQLRMAAEFVNKNPQKKVLDILEGKEPTPKGLLHNSLMLALEEKAKLDKNVNLAIKLASLRSTRMGQELSILTEVSDIRPDIAKMSEIIRARKATAQRSLKEGETIEQKKVKMKSEIKAEQSKLQLKVSEFEKILNQIVC